MLLSRVARESEAGEDAARSSAPDFAAELEARGLGPLRRRVPTTLQLNITRRCNLACHHCHVESGPKRTESLDARGAARVIELLERNPGLALLDITGGAPELNPHFRELVRAARALGRRVIDRCNLTVFWEPGQADTPGFLAAQGVEIVASLPCYTRENVDQQRGRGVFDRSVEGLRRLNALGYGLAEGAPGDPGQGDGPGGGAGRTLRLDLVYNPLGAFLPPPQAELEARYRDELRELFGIRFDRLLTLTNMPIKRFAHELWREGRHAEYLSLLVAHFNPATVEGLMCRDLISVDHEGRLYDCDFNQALDLPVPGPERTLWDVDDLATWADRPVATAPHCFGCTAGSGSSCSGALTRPT